MIPIFSEKRVIIAPLCWGLGHATRCIPIIRHLLAHDCTIMIASDSEALTLLRAEFPQLPFAELPAYGITYRTGSMMRNILSQTPKMIRSIIGEHKAIQKIAKDWRAEIIISDNRLGCRSNDTHNIYLTHQITIPHPMSWIRSVISGIHRTFINRYHACWIPDTYGDFSISGHMSLGHLQIPKTFIGPLSRLQPMSLPLQYDVLAVLSGPEPQRSIFEKSLLHTFDSIPDKRICLIRGTDNNDVPRSRSSNHVLILDLLPSAEINTLLCSSKTIICRAGYSSIMDLIKIHKGAILVPTPGQYEQEYLAQHLDGTAGFIALPQKSLSQLTEII